MLVRKNCYRVRLKVFSVIKESAPFPGKAGTKVVGMLTTQAYKGQGVRGQPGRIKLLPRRGGNPRPWYTDGCASHSRGGSKVRDRNCGDQELAG